MESQTSPIINLDEMGAKARTAGLAVQKLTAADKNQGLIAVAAALCRESDGILTANNQDLERAAAAGMHSGLVDRLRLTTERIRAMADGLREIADLDDPIGEELDHFVRPNGLKITKRRVPLGVIGIIYESRPNVTADAFGLCFKAGNAVILKGGSDALRSNIAITKTIRQALAGCGITPDALQLIESADRNITNRFMKLNRYVDVLIPRGGTGLIRAVVENSTVPVIETGTGNCHIYVDAEADLEMAVPIIVNAKTQRIGVCNACESLVVHEAILAGLLNKLRPALSPAKVELRGDEAVCRLVSDIVPATEEDYGTEYLDYILSIKTVPDLTAAIAHINRYNTKHSDAIITANQEHARQFMNEVDSACVYVNASTRYTDGFEFGFGAEIGISTQKLHARGPMGLKELTSYKYTIEGTGQVRP